MHCWMVSGTPSLYPLDANITPSVVIANNFSRCHPGLKTTIEFVSHLVEIDNNIVKANSAQ